MSETITQGRLRIDANFKRFVDEEVLPGTGLDSTAFWHNFDDIVHDLSPENRQLLRCCRFRDLRILCPG